MKDGWRLCTTFYPWFQDSILFKTPTKDMVICIKIVAFKLQDLQKQGLQVSLDPPSFNSKIFCLSEFRCTFEKLWKKVQRYIDYESRLKATQQQKIQNDTQTSWKFLKVFCKKIEVPVINNENSLIVTELHGASPRMKFSFQIFKD